MLAQLAGHNLCRAVSVNLLLISMVMEKSICQVRQQMRLAASPITYRCMAGKNVPTVFPASLAIGEEQSSLLDSFLGQGLRASYKLDELKTVATTASQDPPESLLYGLVNLQNGNEPTEYWLATDNFFAITQYNRSYFYAMSVIDLGKVIAAARNK